MNSSNDHDWFPTFRKLIQPLAAATAWVWRCGRPWFVTIFDMNSPARILTFATIIACLSLSWTLGGSGPRELGVLFIGLALALTTFASCWFSIATHWIRYLSILIALTLIGILFQFDNGGRNFEWFLFLLPFSIAIPIVITVESTKFLRGRFAKLDSVDEIEFHEGIQFSIRQLIVITTVVAVAFGLWNAFRVDILESFTRDSGGQNFVLIIGSIGATIATFTLLSFWSILGHWRIYRPIITLLIGAVAIYATSLLAPRSNQWFWIAMLVICWFALIALLVLLRFEGYRFVKRTNRENQ